MLFCRLLTFLKINFFKKNISLTLSECQTVWILIRPDFLLVLFAKVVSRRRKWRLAMAEFKIFSSWCLHKCYQQTTKVDIAKITDNLTRFFMATCNNSNESTTGAIT